MAVAALSLAPGAVAVDVGFGGGVGLGLLLTDVGVTGQVHGVDVSTTMIDAAMRRYRRAISAGRLQLHRASMTQLPLHSVSVDGILTVNTIYFVRELDAALAEFARVLKPSGLLVVGLTDPTAMATMPFTAHGFRSRPVTEVISAVLRAGISVVEDRRVGEGQEAFHLLLGRLTAPAV